MCSLMIPGVSGLLSILAAVVITSPFTHGIRMENKPLKVGEELYRETLPLQTGSLLFQLQGLKPNSWYEVKISYPASEGTYVLVSVEAEGIVAISGVQERQTILFNIVCDELFLGLPNIAWPVIVLAVLCLALGFSVPLFFSVSSLKGEVRQPHGLKHR